MIVSDDGHYVYFVATGQLVAGQPLLRLRRGFFMWHDGDTAFIGRNPILEPSFDNVADGQFLGSPPQVRTTPDGRYLLFSSHDGTGFTLGYDHGVRCLGRDHRGMPRALLVQCRHKVSLPASLVIRDMWSRLPTRRRASMCRMRRSRHGI